MRHLRPHRQMRGAVSTPKTHLAPEELQAENTRLYLAAAEFERLYEEAKRQRDREAEDSAGHEYACSVLRAELAAMTEEADRQRERARAAEAQLAATQNANRALLADRDTLYAERDQAVLERDETLGELEHERVRLAGCGVAALGGTEEHHIVKPGDYGCSASYGDVLKLRAERDRLAAVLADVVADFRPSGINDEFECIMSREEYAAIRARAGIT